MDQHAEQLLRESAASTLADGLADGHDGIGRETVLAFSAAMGSSIASIELHDPDTGKLTASWTPSDTTEALLMRLRQEMSRPDTGTWYWLVLRIGPAGEVDSDFYYEERPEWNGLDFRLEPSAYSADLEIHPRSADQRPAWLLERIGESD